MRTSAITDTTINVAWDASTDGGSGVASYRLSRNNAQVGGTITTTQFTDSGLAPGTTYTYSVQAVDTAGNASAQSGTTQAITTGTPPGGLAAKAAWTRARATQRALRRRSRISGTSVASSRVFPNLTFIEPVLMLQAPGDSSKWYVVEQDGFVRSFANIDNATVRSTTSSTSRIA